MLILTNYRLEGFVHKVDFSNIQKPHAVLAVGVAAAAVAAVAFTIALIAAAVFIPPIGAFVGATFVASSVATVSISILVGLGATAIAIVTLLKAREMFNHPKGNKEPAERKPSDAKPYEAKQPPEASNRSNSSSRLSSITSLLSKESVERKPSEPKPYEGKPSESKQASKALSRSNSSSRSSSVVSISSSPSIMHFSQSESNLPSSSSQSIRRSVSTSNICLDNPEEVTVENTEESHLYQACLENLLKMEKETERKLRRDIEVAKEEIAFQEKNALLQAEIDSLEQELEALKGDLGYGTAYFDDDEVALADQVQRAEETHAVLLSHLYYLNDLEKEKADYAKAKGLANSLDLKFKEADDQRLHYYFLPDNELETVYPIPKRTSAKYLDEKHPILQDGPKEKKGSAAISVSSIHPDRVGIIMMGLRDKEAIDEAAKEAAEKAAQAYAEEHDPYAAVWDIDTDSSSSSTSSLQGSPQVSPQVSPPADLSPPKQVTPAEDLSPPSHNLSDGSFEIRLRSALKSLPTTTIVQEDRRAEAELDTIISSGNPPSPKPPSPPISPTLSERALEVFLSGGMGKTQEAEPALLPKCAKYEGLLTFINLQLARNGLPVFEMPVKPEILSENYLGALRKLFQEDVLNLLSTTDDDRIQKVCFEFYGYNKFTENNQAVLKFLGIPEATEGGSLLKKVQTNLDAIKPIYGTSKVDVAARSAGDFFDINFAPLRRGNPPQELHRLIMGQQAVQIFGMGSPTRQDALGRFVEIEPVYENFLREAQSRGMNVLYVSYQNWTNSEKYRNIPIMELQKKYSCLTAITMARDTHFYEGKEGSNDPLQFASEMHDKFFSSRSKPEETGCFLPDRLRIKYAAESISLAHKISDLCHPNRALPLTPDVKRAMVALYYNVLTITIMRGENIHLVNKTCRDGIDRAMGGLEELMEMIDIMNGTESSKDAEERMNKTLFVRAFGARKRAIIPGRVEHFLEVYKVLEQVDPGFTRTRALMHELFGNDMHFMPNALLEAEVR